MTFHNKGPSHLTAGFTLQTGMCCVVLSSFLPRSKDVRLKGWLCHVSVNGFMSRPCNELATCPEHNNDWVQLQPPETDEDKQLQKMKDFHTVCIKTVLHGYLTSLSLPDFEKVRIQGTYNQSQSQNYHRVSWRAYQWHVVHLNGSTHLVISLASFSKLMEGKWCFYLPHDGRRASEDCCVRRQNCRD